MNTEGQMIPDMSGSRVQRAFNNAAYFWLDRNEFPLADFLHSCATHFLLRPDFTNDDAEFILKWIESQRRNPKSTLNKTLRQHVKLGLESKDLQVVRGSLKAFLSKPKAAIPKKTNKVKKAVVKAAKKTKTVKTLKTKPMKKMPLKKSVRKKVIKARKPLKSSKIPLLKKVKSSVKNALLSSLKHKAKKRRVA
jgi:hypothetical protein